MEKNLEQDIIVYTKEAQERLPVVERLQFIGTGCNLILAGNPGTGKTHSALGAF